uniref:Uncharacterized protein n=1 Tax=Nicotiana tabacum TaxID=4097 RepID=A0A1S3XYS6_TOBAC|nr:PREDICTED: uncharacterized protein LOC107770274 [Nicotiana tabacum]
MAEWLREYVWNKLLAKWNTDEWKKKSEQAKANHASSKGGSLHTGGSISFAAHKLRLEKERGRYMSHAEIFEETHKKKKKDGTREHWVETRASDTYIIIKGWKNGNKHNLIQLNQHLMIWLHCGQMQRVE